MLARPDNQPDNPLAVAVVIPTFDRREKVQQALDSVLAQTHPAQEVVVVDDGSTDGTAEAIAQAYPDAVPSVRVVRQPNRGVSAARNLGIAQSRSPWVALLDSDDRWFPDKLALQVEALRSAAEASVAIETRPADTAEALALEELRVPFPVVHCDEIWIRNGRRVNPRRHHAKRGGEIFLHCLPRCAISPSAAMVHRSIFERLGGFDESLPACEDYDLWLRVCARYPVLYVDQPLVEKTGGHADQLSRTPALDRYRIRVLDRLLASGVLSGPTQTEARQATRETLLGKIAVYRAGVEKRGRMEEAAALTALAERWG